MMLIIIMPLLNARFNDGITSKVKVELPIFDGLMDQIVSMDWLTYIDWYLNCRVMYEGRSLGWINHGMI